jgi:hypothetical protein
MKVFCEINLTNFQFWAGAKDNAAMLEYDELEQLEYMLEDIYPEGIEETTINDLMWFDFESVCEWLGLELDVDNWEIKRD